MMSAFQPRPSYRYLVMSAGGSTTPRKLKYLLFHQIRILVQVAGRHLTLMGRLAKDIAWQQNWYVITAELGAT